MKDGKVGTGREKEKEVKHPLCGHTKHIKMTRVREGHMRQDKKGGEARATEQTVE